MSNIVLDMYNDTLIKMLQDAHAGEIGAYYAYAGHIKATKNIEERQKLKQIQLDELEHVKQCKALLNHYGYRTNEFKDSIMKFIGITLGLSCFISGRRVAAWGAGVIERIGMTNYQKMVDISQKLGNKRLVTIFSDMRDVEISHDQYFGGLINGSKEKTN